MIKNITLKEIMEENYNLAQLESKISRKLPVELKVRKRGKRIE